MLQNSNFSIPEQQIYRPFLLTFSVDISSSYAFFYNPGFKAIEDGWSLFQPEEEFAKIIHSADSEWRISYANIDYSV